MAKAFLLVVGVLAYLAVVQLGYDTATAGILGVEKFYTHAQSQAVAISANNR